MPPPVPAVFPQIRPGSAQRDRDAVAFIDAGAVRLRLRERGAVPVDFFGYPCGAEPSAEDLGWAFAAMIASVFVAAVLAIGWLINR